MAEIIKRTTTYANGAVREERLIKPPKAAKAETLKSTSKTAPAAKASKPQPKPKAPSAKSSKPQPKPKAKTASKRK